MIDPREMTELICSGDLEAVKSSLAEDPQILFRCIYRKSTPIHVACWSKQTEIVDELIHRNADVNSRGDRGQTPLHFAIFEAVPESAVIVQILLDAGADPSIADDSGMTPLAYAQFTVGDGGEYVLDILSKPSHSENFFNDTDTTSLFDA